MLAGATSEKLEPDTDINIRKYAKYLLKQGSVTEKRDLLANLRSRLSYKDKMVTLLEETA